MLERLFSGDDPIFNIPDLFGYLIALLIIWLAWTSYERASVIAVEATENAKTTLAPIIKDSESEKTSRARLDHTLPPDVSEKKAPESAISSILNKAQTISENLTVESAGKAVNSINESLNEFVNSLASSSDYTRGGKKGSRQDLNNTRSKPNPKDSLSRL